jgi:hypothetical protein
MPTDLTGFAGPWPVPPLCFFSRKGCNEPPTVRVHGQHQFLHVCDRHIANATAIVGAPHVITALTSDTVTGEELDREYEQYAKLRAAAEPSRDEAPS